MNYRHAYHAGNFCDVAKHAALCLLLERLRGKATAFAAFDTHAGCGVYDLSSDAALKTQEAKAGAQCLLGSGPAHDLPELAPYLGVIEACRASYGPAAYPGSPWILRHFLRPQDRLVLCEKHPEDGRTLKRLFSHDAQVQVHVRDGYEAMGALVPPAERRGLLLCDPPYEANDEYADAAKGVLHAYRKWATGLYVLWYPIKDRSAVWRLTESLLAGISHPILQAEYVHWPEDRTDRLNGGGLLIINPPYQMDVVVLRLYEGLKVRLQATGEGGIVRLLSPLGAHP